MKTKPVNIVVTVPAAFMKRLKARVRPLGMDPVALVEKEVKEAASLECLINDRCYLFSTYVFPNRAAAKRAALAEMKGCRVRLWSKREATYMTAKGEVTEEFHPPGLAQLKRKVDRLNAKAVALTDQKERVYVALEKVVGMPVLRK